MSTKTIEQDLETAVAHHQAGQLAEAEALYRRILAMQPLNADALHLLGVLAHQVGQPEAAVELITRAIAENANEAVYHSNIGEAYRASGRLNEAVACYKRALTIQPEYPEACNNLADVLSEQGRLPEAIAAYTHALQLNPVHAEAYNNLGNVFARTGQLDKAILAYQRALELKPDFAQTHYNLGNAWKEQGRLDEAQAAYCRALEIAPSMAEAHSNLGSVFKNQGRVEEAIACYRRAIALAPDNSLIHSSLLFSLFLHPETDIETLQEEHHAWDRRHGEPRRQFFRPHPNAPDPDRRLKVGYVSPDLRAHPIGHFLLPLLAHQDREHFETTCYAEVARPDAVTQRLRAQADQWRSTCGWTEEQLAEQVREDGIDVLVDLALHTGGNRLPVFARKPAPVQVTFAGYPDTTGLTAIDYRLSDRFLEPPGQEAYSSEDVFRLPDSFWLFAPPEDSPEVTLLPASVSGRITFGCLGNFGKVNTPALARWAQVLHAVPGSRLLLLTGEGAHRERTRETLQDLGIAADRVEFIGQRPRLEYFALYQQVDLVLDTLPYNGHNTSLDALWMGVPVVSLVGQTAVGRGGLSILSNIGLPELVAYTEEEYVRIAVELANDLPRLAHLRATIRERMLGSPLMDAPRFAGNIEDAYRTMWKSWCAVQTSNHH